MLLRYFFILCGLVIYPDYAIGDEEREHLKMAALGDSVTQGVNATSLGSHPNLSWSTGSDIQSHLKKLEEEGYQVEAVNAAVKGASSLALPYQIHNLPYVPDYVTIMVGANEVCGDGVVDTAGNIRAAIETLKGTNPEVQIVLVPIPKLLSLYESGVDSRSCRFRWWLFNICPTFLGSHLTDELRAANQAKVDAINDALVEVAADFGAKYNRNLGDVNIQPEDISDVDCFHPSITGQQLISDLTY